MSKPNDAKLAFRLYIATLILFPIVSLFDSTESPPLPDGSGLLLALVIMCFVLPFFGLMALVIYKAYQGRNWARITLLVITVAGTMPYAQFLLAQFALHPAITAMNLLLTMIQLLALGLLFTKSSNEWYRDSKLSGGPA